jgi:NAD(P)H dehydrogenase (quinone)
MNPTNLIILVLYYSRHGATRKLAELIAQGIESVPGCEARLRTVPAVSTVAEATEPDIPAAARPMSSWRTWRVRRPGAGLAHPLRQHGGGDEVLPRRHLGQWLSGTLSGKPAAVFTSTGSLHGGQESTLLSMMIPLLHHGMMVMGLPYTMPELMTTVQRRQPLRRDPLVRRRRQQAPSRTTRSGWPIALGRRLAESRKLQGMEYATCKCIGYFIRAR